MNKVLYILFYPLRLVCYALIYLYKFLISPLIPKSCIYYPSCSTYMLDAIKEWGIVKGIYLGSRRICRCTPFHKGGVDFVPINIKGGNKWVF